MVDGPAADQRANHVPNLPDGGMQRHRVHHVLAGHQVGGEGETGRHLHCHQPAQDENDNVHVPDLRQAGQSEEGQGQGDGGVAQNADD